MPVHRERTDPARAPEGGSLVHRRWLLPDDAGRLIVPQQLVRLWRGLCDLRFVDAGSEVSVDRLALPPAGEAERQEMPAFPAGGALLGSAGLALLVTQVVWPAQQGLRDPYAGEGSPTEGYRDYTLYSVDHADFLLLPLAPEELLCSSCGRGMALQGARFGEGSLFRRDSACACGSLRDPARDRARLRSGQVFLLEELLCRAALSIELPAAPADGELPDGALAALLGETLGGFDELADDFAAAAE